MTVKQYKIAVKSSQWTAPSMRTRIVNSTYKTNWTFALKLKSFMTKVMGSLLLSCRIAYKLLVRLFRRSRHVRLPTSYRVLTRPANSPSLKVPLVYVNR